MLYKFKKIILLVFILIYSFLLLCSLIIVLPKLIDDISNFDRDNTSEEKVINANYYAFYKNVFVIKVPIKNSGFSFGIIFLGNEVENNNTVKHEYGHYLQLKEVGIYKYTRYVFIPSVRGFWSGIPYEEYYSQPWEYGADLYGGVNRKNYSYNSYVIDNYNFYWNEIVNKE